MKEKKDPFVVSVNLGLKGTDRNPIYHFLYGSQVYGTLFGVYGRFNGKESGGQYTINSLSLKLLNYQGVLNIGFTNHKLIYTPDSVTKVKNENHVYFGVKGATLLLDKPLKFTSPLIIEQGKAFPLTFNRILYPLPGFYTRRQRTTTVNQRLSVRVPKSPYFDSEFQYRNGGDYYDQVLRPGMMGYEGVSMDKNPEEMFMPSLRCHESFVKLYF